MRRLVMGASLGIVIAIAGCDDGEATTADSGTDAGRDAAVIDAFMEDAPMIDAFMEDAPMIDAFMEDAPMIDAFMEDAPMIDAFMEDGGPTCGNGVLDTGEECDATLLGTATCETELGTGATGTLSCTAGCTLDTTMCQLCGDALASGTEECDLTDLRGATCASVGGGLVAGTLGCTASCTLDTTMCVTGAAPTAAGQIVITEIMQNPNDYFDTEGEWFEVHNPGTTDLDLRGCSFTGTSTTTTDTFTVTTSLIVPAGGYRTFATDSTVAGAPGFTPSYRWIEHQFLLANVADGITLACAGVTIDAVLWDDGVTFPDPTGQSMTLDPRMLTATANDVGSNWCNGLDIYGTGSDRGTPGRANDPCQVFPVTFCRLQSPLTIAGMGGETTTIYGRVYAAGLTDQTGMTDPYPRLYGQVGYGPDGSDPATAPDAWTWFTAVTNDAYGPSSPSYEANNDEYQGVITAPLMSGSYDYAYRFSADTGFTWVYCDAGDPGSSDGYSAANAGALTIVAPPRTVTAIEPASIDVATLGTGILTVVISGPAPVGGQAVTIASGTPTSVSVPLTVTVPAGATRATIRVRGAAAAGSSVITASSGTSMASATVNVVATAAPAPVAGDLSINELLYDPAPGEPDGDSNCNGVRETMADEYVELVNVSAHPIDLAGVSLWDETNYTTAGSPPRFTFAALVLGPGEAAVVFGGPGGTVTTPPWCAGATPTTIGDAVAVNAGVGGDLGLTNVGDTVYVTATATTATVLAMVSWPDGAAIDQSYTRSPDITGTFVPFANALGRASDRGFSPGTHLDGSGFADASAP